MNDLGKFEVSANWMDACGYGNEAQTFDVIRVKHCYAPNPDYNVFYVVNKNGREWTVAAFRGRYIP